METQTKMGSYRDNINKCFTKVVYYTQSQSYTKVLKAICLGDYDINTHTLRLDFVNALTHFVETGWKPKTLEWCNDINSNNVYTSIFITDKYNIEDIYDGVFFMTDTIEDLSEKLLSEQVSKIITFDNRSDNEKNKIMYDGNIIKLPDDTIRLTDTAIKDIRNICLIDNDSDSIKFENNTLYIPSNKRICDLYHNIMLSPILQNTNIYGKGKNILNFYNHNILSKFTTVYITDYGFNKTDYITPQLNALTIYGIINVNDNGIIS